MGGVGAAASHVDGVGAATCDTSALVDCERQGNAWRGTLFAAAPSNNFVFEGKCSSGCNAGEWYAPCADAHRAAVRCATPLRELVVLTHMPKAGGSSLGEAVSRLVLHAGRSGTLGAPCRLLWNGKSRAAVCRGLREWIGRRSVRRVPPLPFSTSKAAATGVNGSLESALAFRRCGFFWAQHMDFSVVEQIRRAHPRLHVRPIIVLRHPVRALRHVRVAMSVLAVRISRVRVARRCELQCTECGGAPDGVTRHTGRSLLLRVSLQKALPLAPAWAHSGAGRGGSSAVGQLSERPDSRAAAEQRETAASYALPGGQVVGVVCVATWPRRRRAPPGVGSGRRTVT